MDIKVTTTVIQTTNYKAKYLIAEFEPRFWEDVDIIDKDGQKHEDSAVFENAEISGKVKIENEIPDFCNLHSEGYIRWKIDIDEGKILDWNGLKVSVYYKVCDQGQYTLLDSDENVIFEVESYVPKILSIDDDGYGDYIYIDVDENGYIKEWTCNNKLIQDIYDNKLS